MGTRNIRRTVAGVALAGAIGVGGLTVAAVNPLGIAGAQDGSSTTTTTTTVANPSQQGAARQGARTKVVQDALASLVTDGTLTQDQADAVAARLRDAAKQARSDRHDKRSERRQEMVGVAATALGMSSEDLTSALKDGQTLKQVAESRRVEPQKVIDALVAAADERIDAAVTSGRLDALRADRLKERATTRIERLVNEGARRRGGH